MRLPSVGQQDNEDDEEEQASSGCDTEDGRQGQQAVRPDVDYSWRDVETSYLDLDTDKPQKHTQEHRQDRTVALFGP